MSGRSGILGIKRKHSDAPVKELSADEQKILDLIKSKGDMGIWKRDIRKELNLTNTKVVDNCVKSLLTKQKIKEVANVRSKGRKRLMAMEIKPSKELTGGDWYDNEGKLDADFIHDLKRFCKKKLEKMNIATVDGLCNVANKSGCFTIELKAKQVEEILDNLVLEKDLIKVQSNGVGEFASFPMDVDCYKLKPQSKKMGAFSMIPCGVCPRINHCAPDGVISPITCVYYTKWLEF